MLENKTILFFEPEIKGHQLDYIEHLCHYYVKKSVSLNVIFVVNNLFHKTLVERDKLTLFDSYTNGGVKFVEMSSDEANKCASRNLIKSALYRWYIAKKYALLYKIDHLHFLFLDHLQLPLGIGLNLKSNFTISGILFNVTLNYQSPNRNFLMRIKRIAKLFLYQRMLNNNKFISAFSLDPFFKEYATTHLNNSSKIISIPDPSLFSKKLLLYKNEVIDFSDDKRILFVMFGYIQQRKGIFQLLKSIKYIDKSLDKKIAICVAGKIDVKIRDKIKGMVNEIERNREEIKLDLWDRYVSDRELISIILSSNCILAPYQHFSGSSGVILWAAGACKPVITQKYGLLGRWARSHGLGIAIDTTNPQEIAKAISHMINSKGLIYDSDKMQSFVRKHTPDNFSSIIFDNFTKYD